MTEEIPIWVNGIIQWVSGVDRKTTCKDVIEVLLLGDGGEKHNVKDYAIMERWRRVERPLDENSKILKIWSHWGDEKKEVRLCLKRINNEIDSGRGSPVTIGNTPSLKRRRHHRSRVNGKPPWSHQEALHPKRLAELGGLYNEEYEDYRVRKPNQFDDEDRSELENDLPIYESRHCGYAEKIYGRRSEDGTCSRKKSGHKSYQCPGTGVLHSTLIASNEDEYNKPTTSKCCSKRQSKGKVRNSENIEKLMKLILAQGATIQNQLQKLKEREEQIESLEHERHRERVEKNGRNYLLETYLGSLGEAEIPVAEEERGNDSGVHTEGGSDQMNTVWEKNKFDRLEGPRHSSRADRSKAEDSNSKTLPSRTKRSRSESRTSECRCDGNNFLKRTLSDNALAETGEIRNGNEDAAQYSESDIAESGLELKGIQSQVSMWEKVFKINKKLEKEEENLVRLHIKIKRYQAESVKLEKEENSEKVQSKEGNELDEDRKSMQKDLENLREDLDHNSKEIYQNFTKLRENDEVVEKKRSILNRLMSDLERTEKEYSMLSEMVQAIPEDPLEGRTSFSERTEEEAAEIVPIRLYNGRKVDSDPNSIGLPEVTANLNPVQQKIKQFNQRVEAFTKPEQTEVKPKILKISFDDQVQIEKSRQHSTTTPGTIKGILKNRNMDVQQYQKCDYDQTTEKGYQHSQEESYAALPYRECASYYRPTSGMGEEVRNVYSGKFQRQGSGRGNEQNVYPNPKTNIHNDTDSSTSSDTSGLCSMYSSSPTAEEPYSEPSYVLDTLV